MVQYDKSNKQLLTSACIQCPDVEFTRRDKELEEIGCCSHSPTFGLGEIQHMLVWEGKEEVERQLVYREGSELSPYSVMVNAFVAPSYHKEDTRNLNQIEKADLKLSYSTCQFFVSQQGCSLSPHYKPSVCRSFICSTVENQLESADKQAMNQAAKEIRKSSNETHDRLKKLLKWYGVTLKKDRFKVYEVLIDDYIK
ncbi:hypothetical protein [Salsuginibacillus kocurii]|uniref:hypothetical protein n=1 Tax=Salsuginibacillus kocurii TaxID=427078 RepID=UPI00036DEEEC|nr:hypothetical protein [Salsuginibacillus kocurii]